MPYEDHPISRSRGLLALAKVELNGEAVAWILPLGTDRVVDEGVEYIHSVVLEGCRSEYEGEERGKEGQLLASSFGGLPERSPKPAKQKEQSQVLLLSFLYLSSTHEKGRN